MNASEPSTTITQVKPDAVLVPNLRVRVVPPDGEALVGVLGLEPVRIGTASECHLTIKDPKVSRTHLELRLTEQGILVRDLQSKNGTFAGPVRIMDGYVGVDVWITLGDSHLIVEVAGPPGEVAVSSSLRFGRALGRSLLMRSLFAKLDHAAKFNSPILLIGEEGTGKRTLAEAVHRASPWAAGPWVVLDAESVPAENLEVEIFGCAAGVRADLPEGHAGILEQSHGGTLYIAEPAAIPFGLQQRLASALDARTCYRVGGTIGAPFEVRLTSGTRAKLGPLVTSGHLDERFSLWLSIVTFEVPALRDRKEDIALLVESFLAARTPPLSTMDLPPDAVRMFESHDFARNVDELKSLVERLVIHPDMTRDALIGVLTEAPRASEDVSIRRFLGMQLKEARNLMNERFDRLYLAAQLEAHGGNVAKAAAAIGIERESVYRLLKRYGLRKDDDGSKR